MKKRFILLVLLTASPVFSAKSKDQKFHRLLVTYNAQRYHTVYHGTILRVIPEGYRKNGRVLDVLQVKIRDRVKPTKGSSIHHILFSRRNFTFKKGESGLFFAHRTGRISFIDPPLVVENGKVSIDSAAYPLQDVLKWAGDRTPIGTLLKGNRSFLSWKRVRDRQAGFILKMRRKEIFLLYKINNKSTLQEKVLWFIELGHTRISLKKYPEAEQAFLYAKRKYAVSPLIVLMADRGIALLAYYRGDTGRAISLFRKLIERKAGADGYRATLRNDLARLYEMKKDLKNALEQYRLASSEFSDRYNDRAFALFNLGEIYRRQKEYRKALENYRKAYSLFNTHLAATFRKGGTRFPAWYFAAKQRIRRKGR